VTSLRKRFGMALQRQRQLQGLSQAELATLANVSLKYIGEIERGEANVSIDRLERLSDALEWDPFELPLREQDTLPEGVRTLLLAELAHMQYLVQTAINWVQTLDAAMVRRSQQLPIAAANADAVAASPPRDDRASTGLGHALDNPRSRSNRSVDGRRESACTVEIVLSACVHSLQAGRSRHTVIVVRCVPPAGEFNPDQVTIIVRV
jgi:transcriptional regulator with XRE-family HTH domain